MADLVFGPIAGAMEKLAQRTPVASPWRTREWERVPLALRERAQFSAGVESIRVMATIQDQLQKAVGMLREQAAHGFAGVDIGSFIATLKRTLREEGIGQGDGGLTDITSARRLQLIWEFQRESAAEYARWNMGQDPAMLEAWPAQEFLRVESRQVPRDWAPRWDGCFAPFEGATRASSGRMAALKNHPGWMALSRFGTPWPPFDFGSGMGVENVSRTEAVALGLLGPTDQVASATRDFNAALEAGVEGLSPAWREQLTDAFGDQVQFQGDRAVWQGNLIGDLVERVREFSRGWREFDSRAFKGQQIDLGEATAAATQKAAKYMDISGMRMRMRAEHIFHFFREHGDETDPRQRSITQLDVELLPHVWREPDKVEKGHGERALIFWKRLLGTTRMVEWQQHKDQRLMVPASMLVKK